MKACLLAFLFISVVSCIEFQQFEGKIADPCARFVDPVSRKDCPQDSQWAAATNTILLPSVTSTQVTTTGATPIGASLRSTTLTITGNFPTVPTSGVVWGLALATPEDTCSKIDFNYLVIPLYPATALGVGNVFPNQLTFNLNGIPNPILNPAAQAWDAASLEAEDRPRLLCFTDSLDVTFTAAGQGNQGSTLWRYTGFKIGTVWNCGDSTATSCGSNSLTSAVAAFLTPLQQELRRTRTVCCKRDTRMTGAQINAGQCINPNIQSCCGAAATEIAQEKCCNPTFETVSQVDNMCPCSASADCPASERCCLPMKYSQLTVEPFVFLNSDGTTTTTRTTLWAGANWQFFRGSCYRPTQYHCCDTGSVFDPGSQQCCKINGVQSINSPCPCNADADCVTQHLPAESRTYNFTCCGQTAVSPIETSTATCSIYANYPSGQGVAEAQRCLGVCINPSYQFCCNGAVCMANYERCCNSTCCNIWTSTCFNALRPGAKGNRYNSLNWAQHIAGVLNWQAYTFAIQEEVYEQCSEVEHLTTTKAFWVFVLPAMLLLVSHIGLALVLVFAAKATPRSFSKLELMMMGVALATAYLAMPLFFAPVWKYGIWIIFAQFIVFLTATARIHWLNVLCLVVQFITLVFLFDPFHGNAYLTLSNNRQGFGTVPTNAPDDLGTSGILHSITKSWHTVDLTASQQWCTRFYDYFLLDPTLRDVERYDNPQILTFGYCSRGWSTALLIFTFFVMTLSLIQIILVLLGLFYRFKTDSILEQGYYEPESTPEAEKYYYQ